MGKVVLVTGGARSGKSGFAETYVKEAAGSASTLYLATAEARDDEMKERVARHRQDRPAHWLTVEAHQGVLEACQSELSRVRAVLLDCLTLLVTNHLLVNEEVSCTHGEIEERVIEELRGLICKCRAQDLLLVMVTNEVGWGLVPEYPLGRVFRDLAGRVNQWAAAQSDEVYLLVSGLPLKLKG